MKLTGCIVMALAALTGPANALCQQEFPLPEIPSELRAPEARASYLVEHFWDNVDPAADDGVTEADFVNFLSVWPVAGDEARQAGAATLMRRAEANSKAFRHVADLADLYLFSPDSPMENEAYYVPFLRAVIESELTTDSERAVAQWKLETALTNAPGTEAADFEYVTATGERGTLREAARSVGADGGLLLILYDPECDHCLEVMGKLRGRTPDSLKVLAVCVEGTREAWLETVRQQIPAEWTGGYDESGIQDEDLYIIRSFPAMYLIDHNGLVAAKSPRPEQLTVTP